MGAFNPSAFSGETFEVGSNVEPTSKFIFLPEEHRVVVRQGVVSFTATELYSAWKVWARDNMQYLQAFRVVGGDPLGGGLYVASYFFFLNGWRLRPAETSHNLLITGNLFVDGGGVPVVSTLGNYQVNVNYTVPVQAQGISVSGSVGPTAAEIAETILLALRSTTIPVNLTQIKGQVIAGTGTRTNPWGP